MDRNLTLIQFFHWYYPNDGSLWKHFKDQQNYLEDLGINMVWLPPPCKTEDGINGVGYGSYDLFDLGEFDQKGTVRTKYGTRQELLEAIDSAHQKKMQVLLDAVLNHKGGGDETERVNAYKVNPDNRTETISEVFEIEAFTKFTFPGRRGKYSKFIWDFTCFSGVDYDNLSGETGVYCLLNPHGDDWEEVTSKEKGNFDYLMYSDIDFRNNAVRDEIKYWAEWMITENKFDGFRFDAVKHMPSFFFNEFLDHIRGKLGRDFFGVAEFWENDVRNLSKFMDETEGRMHMFDAPLHYNFHLASLVGNHFDMRKIFDNTLTQLNPLRSVTLVENHDSQPLQALESTIDYWFKPLAYAMMLLRTDGLPCVFYADLYGAKYTDKGSDGQDYDIEMVKVQHIDELIKVRKDLAYGYEINYLDHDTCVGWVRHGLDEFPNSGIAVVLSNGHPLSQPARARDPGGEGRPRDPRQLRRA